MKIRVKVAKEKEGYVFGRWYEVIELGYVKSDKTWTFLLPNYEAHHYANFYAEILQIKINKRWFTLYKM